MAAPTPNTNRTTNASARMIGEGYQVLIVLDGDPDIEFEEQEVTPPSLMMDEFIDRTTNHNAAVRTKQPSSLYDVGPITATVTYDAMVLNSIKAIIGVNTTCTVVFPNGDAWACYAALKEFKPAAMVRGQQPKAEVVIVPTNMDPSDCSEAEPVFLAGAGTAC